MTFVIEQILTIITTPPGNLAYHMVLAFSIAGALFSAINHYRGGDDILGRRTILGLSLILAARLGLFLVAGLVWQAFGISETILPTLDRAVNAICLVLIVWLWVFPEPVRLADAATVLLGLIVIVLFAFSSLWWANLDENIDFIGSLADIIWQGFSLLVLIAGIGLLLYRRPRSWEIGLAMFIVLFFGHLAQLLFPLGDSDYPGFVRLAQMASYPMLLLLPQRTQTPAVVQKPVSQRPLQERRFYNIDPHILESLLILTSEISPIETCQEICRTVSQSILADLCLLITPPDAESNMSILCGYDLNREVLIVGANIESDAVPTMSESIRVLNPLRLPASTTSEDIESLCYALGLPSNGSMLAAPITIPGQDAPLGTVLISLYSGREWTDDDQTYLLEINSFITQLLQHSAQVAVLEDQLAESHREINNLQSRQDELQPHPSQGLSQTETIAALIATHEEAQDTIERLEAELESLQLTTQGASSDLNVTPQEIDIIEGELRLTLEEVTHLRSALTEADQKIHSLENSLQPESNLSGREERASSIIQELRQPLSSILGYTELLLSESVGILGALQRKFIDRIKASSERMETLIDELTSLDMVRADAIEVASNPLDLNSVVIEAITHTEASMQAKNITLNTRVPELLPPLNADRDAAVQVLTHLLQNATEVSPEGSETSLRAQVVQGEESLDYVLFQVSDMGEGIPVDDLPRVFSGLNHADSAEIQGIGNTGEDLSIVKTLVEANNGRIWVDTERGKGSTFSILVPVSTTVASTPIEVEESISHE